MRHSGSTAVTPRRGGLVSRTADAPSGIRGREHTAPGSNLNQTHQAGQIMHVMNRQVTSPRCQGKADCVGAPNLA